MSRRGIALPLSVFALAVAGIAVVMAVELLATGVGAAEGVRGRIEQEEAARRALGAIPALLRQPIPPGGEWTATLPGGSLVVRPLAGGLYLARSLMSRPGNSRHPARTGSVSLLFRVAGPPMAPALVIVARWPEGR